MNDAAALDRWRLLLGATDELGAIGEGSTGDAERYAEVLDYLFDRDVKVETGEGSVQKRGQANKRSGSRSGGQGASTFRVPDWVQHVNELFPQAARQQLETELIRRKGIDALLREPEILERIEPSLDLARTLLTFKGQLNDETRRIARKIVSTVVEELKNKIKLQVEPALLGAIQKQRHNSRKVFRNLDLKTTLRRNLQNWDAAREQLIVDRSWFYAAEKNARPWHIILGIDQSGSMLDSVIFSAIMGSIFYELPSMRTSVFVFDTEVVDLTPHVVDPVDMLFEVQLGGGTSIHKAAAYAQGLVRDAQRTIFILISDFYEGGDPQQLMETVSSMHQAGSRLIALPALSYDASPAYDIQTVRQLHKCGMEFLECTPEQLADAVGRIIC